MGETAGAGRGTPGFGPGRRYARLVQRRPGLFGFVVAVVAARIVFDVIDMVESRVVGYSLVITAVLLVEVVVVWRSVRDQRGRVSQPRAGSDASGLERALELTERYGAPVIYATTAGVVVADLALALNGARRATLLDVTAGVRWVQLALLIGVLVASRSWESRYPEQPNNAAADSSPHLP